MEKMILLASTFGNNIFTRSSISNFFEKINSLENINIKLDFNDVKFISRSCADEYLKQKKVSKKKITEVNMSKDVCAMFTNVQNQYKNIGFDVSFKVCSNNNDLITA